MDRTCPVENCSLINRAMRLLYTSIGALDIYIYIYKISIVTDKFLFLFFPFLFNNIRCNFSLVKNPNYSFPYEITLNTFEKKTFERVDI